MTTYVMRNGQLVDKRDAEPARNPATYVISDHMPALRNHADGRTYDSKARFRAATKAAGCIEIGNEKLPDRKPAKLDKAKRRDDIRKAIYDLKNGYKPTIPEW